MRHGLSPKHAVLLLSTVVCLVCGQPSRELPLLATLPEFRLTDQNGRPFGSRELRGKVWLADFMFTRCPTACPRLTALMQRVREHAKGIHRRLHFVSFTIDPAHDTPPVLLAYARQHRATRSWSFLTGSYEALEQTIVRGFKVSTGREEEEGPARGAAIPDERLAEVFHGTHLVLVDPALRVRGYYGSEDDGVEEHIAADARLLLAE
jgi:protein SCO1/2